MALVHGHIHREDGRKVISRTYRTWQNMWTRCRNPNHPAYKNYGGRGITVCDRWKSFASFLEDMGERPPRLCIGRIDNNKGYYKENCRWETRLEQNKNRRVVGVGFDKETGRWRARIWRRGKLYVVGRFKTLEEGILAREKFLLEWNL